LSEVDVARTHVVMSDEVLALVAGTARALGAILLTDNVRDFPIGDLEVRAPPTG
jgi:predicted nucleic acid-binding protein